jgi:hypothetical protein
VCFIPWKKNYQVMDNCQSDGFRIKVNARRKKPNHPPMEQPYEHHGQIIELFMRFCIDANIDVKQSGTSLGKYILAYQRNIEHKVAFDVL